MRSFLETIPAPLSSLVGRETEVEDVRRLLSTPGVRLVVLTGTGGVGKTRLAMAVAASLQRDDAPAPFPDGIAFISLVGVDDPALVLPTIASALAIPTLTDRLGSLALALDDRRMLLILDNFEQIVAAAPDVVALLRTLPTITILVTSRRVLGITGEVDYAVRPLPLPDQHLDQPLSELARNPAAALFLQRAGHHYGTNHHEFTDRDVSAVAEICRRLDGLPLAIELAAARSTILAPAQLLGGLDDRLSLLRRGAPDLPARHQTMRSTIDWSYDLLTEPQRRWLRRLAVFSDGFTQEAATAVVDGMDAVAGSEADGSSSDGRHADLDILEDLVGHSLISVLPGASGKPRFAMLETVRDYALERLRRAGEDAAASLAHARFFKGLAERITVMRSPELREEWVDAIGHDQDNLRAAIGWFLRHGSAEDAIRITSSLWRFWEIRSLTVEGSHWLEMALSKDGPVDPSIRGIAINNLANLLSDRSDLLGARDLYQQALFILRDHGSRRDVADVLNNLGRVAMLMGDYTAANAWYDQAIPIRRETGDDYGLSTVMMNVANTYLHAGDVARSLSALEEGRAIRLRYQDRRGVVFADLLEGRALLSIDGPRGMELLERVHVECLALGDRATAADTRLNQARYRVATGDAAGARELIRQAVNVFIDGRHRRGAVACFEVIAQVALRSDRPFRAARLLGAATAERETLHTPLAHLLQPWLDDVIAETRREAGAAPYAAAFADGRRAGMAATLAEADLELLATTPDNRAARAARDLRVPGTVGPGTAVDASAVPLTQRERDVLRYVAEGLGDREIGYELGIGQRTVSTHVANILVKFGVPSRAAAAAMAVRIGVA